MEESFFSRNRDAARKRTRKRSYTRKASLSRSFINMAEARREIVSALQLHRSSSSSSSPSPSLKPDYSNPTVLCSSSHHNQQQCYHQLTDSMPVPEPTWSTTAPAVLCAPVPSMEVLEVEWFDNVSTSSYSWWLGFLNSLDGKRDAVNGSVESSDLLGPCLVAKDIVDKSASDVDDQNPFTDEWMIFPAAEERGDQL